MAKTKKVQETKLTYATRTRRTNGAPLPKMRSRPKSTAPARRVLGKHIVADPKICHGKATFIGTRIFVSDVLEMVQAEMPWDEIVSEWHGHITKEAIAEAVGLARRAFAQLVDKPQNRSLEL